MTCVTNRYRIKMT